MQPWHNKLAALEPCSEALEWAKKYSTVQEAWDACERGDWLAWFAGRVGLTPKRRRQLVLAAVDIAETVAHLNPDPRVMEAITAARTWANNPTEKNAAAWAAAWDAAGDAAWAAAWDAAWAGDASLSNSAQIIRKHLTCPKF